MSNKLSPQKAADILERWISFYGMEDASAWSIMDYGYVKRASRAMRLAIGLLRGGNLSNRKEAKKAVRTLREWPTVHIMDNPEVWEDEDFPFVKSAFESVLYAASYLEEQVKGKV